MILYLISFIKIKLLGIKVRLSETLFCVYNIIIKNLKQNTKKIIIYAHVDVTYISTKAFTCMRDCKAMQFNQTSRKALIQESKLYE